MNDVELIERASEKASLMRSKAEDLNSEAAYIEDLVHRLRDRDEPAARRLLAREFAEGETERARPVVS